MGMFKKKQEAKLTPMATAPIKESEGMEELPEFDDIGEEYEEEYVEEEKEKPTQQYHQSIETPRKRRRLKPKPKPKAREETVVVEQLPVFQLRKSPYPRADGVTEVYVTRDEVMLSLREDIRYLKQRIDEEEEG